MKRFCFRIVGAAALMALWGCADGAYVGPVETLDNAAPRPVARPTGSVPPPANARTVEQFDTSTPQDRAAATQTPPAAGESLLGSTVASLGNPAQPGFWLETPLVGKRQPGRVDYGATGKSVNVELIPIEGPPTAGSRISLAALRLLEAPLGGLAALTVYAGGQ